MHKILLGMKLADYDVYLVQAPGYFVSISFFNQNKHLQGSSALKNVLVKKNYTEYYSDIDSLSYLTRGTTIPLNLT